MFLDFNRADPFAARLDHALAAIGDLYVAIRAMVATSPVGNQPSTSGSPPSESAPTGEPSAQSRREVEMGNAYMDIGRIGGELGYAPRYTMERAVAECADWFRTHEV
jgi:nucleoside-diphosphate-sugar epimerase